MGIDSTSVEKYHLRTADAYRCAPAPAHSSPENPSSIESHLFHLLGRITQCSYLSLHPKASILSVHRVFV